MQKRFLIRKIAPEHFDSKGFVHYTSWQETYQGLMPDAVLDAQSLERCQQHAAVSPGTTLVALDRANDNQVAGFIDFLPTAREHITVGDAAEIMALYVLRSCQGYGLGRRLVEAALAQLPGKQVALYVLEGNDHAIGFYRRMGFEMTGHVFRHEREGGPLVELEMLRTN